ncbi:MAG: outer-membrane lipoprotein carrier protein LolA [Pseudomonadota bacterium]
MTKRRTQSVRRLLASMILLAGAVGFASSAVPARAAAETGQIDQNGAVASINTYLNSFETLTGEFIQFGPDGSRIEGTFALQRPGKIHFKYAEPAQVDIVSDGRSVAVRDKRRDTQDLWPLKRTPLRFLLSSDIDLMATSNVTDVSVAEDIITIVVQESTLFGEGTLTMIFDGDSHELRQWTVTDSQGLDTSVAIYNVEKDRPVNPERFAIQYLREAPLGSNK